MEWLILATMFNTAAIVWLAVFRVRKVVVHSGGSKVASMHKYKLKSRKS